MFPPAQARGLRYKAILSDCRKQSQEMEMHCVTLSATSGYLFGRILPFFFFRGNPRPSISLGLQESMSGSWRNKPAVSCSLLRLQGGIASLPSHPSPTINPPPLTPSSKQKPMWGIQLVNLTLDTLPLVCGADTPFLRRSSHNKLSNEEEAEKVRAALSEAIDFEP